MASLEEKELFRTMLVYRWYLYLPTVIQLRLALA
jgi:hypothetical protein